MNPTFPTLLGIVAPVFAVIAAGLALRRVEWLTAEADETLLRMTVNFLFPCLIADTILGNRTLARAENLLVPPLIGFAGVVAGFGLAALAAKLLKLPPPTRRAFVFATGLQNYGYLPLPLVLALFPRDTAGVLFTHNLGVEIALWTVGMWILGGAPRRELWRKIVNVPLCALLASIGLNALGAANWLPAFVLSALHLIAQSAIPLALLLTGAMLADFLTAENAAGFLARKGALTVANVVRLVLIPLVLLALGRWLPLSRELRQILVVQAAMPAAMMMPIILARHYRADSTIAVGIVLTTTAVSLVTIPAWLRFGTWWLGL